MDEQINQTKPNTTEKKYFQLYTQINFVCIQQYACLYLFMPYHYIILLLTMSSVRGGADKSSARPGRKHATATKLGIYSTYSPRSSINFLDRCSNFCKPLKK